MIPESGCPASKLEAYTDEVFEEIYGTDSYFVKYDGLVNENHAFAEGEAEYYSLMELIGLSMDVFDGPEYWTNKVADGKDACSIPGSPLFKIKDGSTQSIDAVIDAMPKEQNKPQCGDNVIGELSFAFFLTWCDTHGLDCSRARLFEVWLKAATEGWCSSFEEVFSRPWGDYVCAMEAADAYDVDANCVAAQVPCLDWRDPAQQHGALEEEEEGDALEEAPKKPKNKCQKKCLKKGKSKKKCKKKCKK